MTYEPNFGTELEAFDEHSSRSWAGAIVYDPLAHELWRIWEASAYTTPIGEWVYLIQKRGASAAEWTTVVTGDNDFPGLVYVNGWILVLRYSNSPGQQFGATYYIRAAKSGASAFAAEYATTFGLAGTTSPDTPYIATDYGVAIAGNSDLFAPFSTGIAATILYSISNLPPGSSADFRSTICYTADPRTDAGWQRADLSVAPYDYSTVGERDSEPYLFSMRDIAANDNEVVQRFILYPSFNDLANFPDGNHHWAALSYNFASETWTKQELERGSNSANVGLLFPAGKRWLIYRYEGYGADPEFTWRLSDTPDIAGSYTELFPPTLAGGDLPEDTGLPLGMWAGHYIGDDEWMATVAYGQIKTDEWGEDYFLTRRAWVVLNLDWSEWRLLADPLPSGDEWTDGWFDVTGNPPYIVRGADPVVWAEVSRYARFVDPDNPDNGWWEYDQNTEYWLSIPSSAGWD